MLNDTMTRADFLRGATTTTLLSLAGATSVAGSAQATKRLAGARADWQIGPFTRPVSAPVIKPDRSATFLCPMQKRRVDWMSAHTFNPTSVVRDGKMVVLFRAEDQPSEQKIGSHTSRLGYASSDDGLTFSLRPEPVLFPADDTQKSAEWPGGCEDPRVCEGPDGTYYVTYTQWNRSRTRLGIASSRDLITWRKHGSAFAGTPYENLPTKSGAVIQRIDRGRLRAAKINGKYWMVFGEGLVRMATSDDLIHWSPVETPSGEVLLLMTPRAGRFDSDIPEVGPSPILTERGIVMLYNGKNSEFDLNRDPAIGAGAYAGGQVLLDPTDPTRILERTTVPFIKPELPWEKSGQYKAGTTFIEGLTYFKRKLYLYYGTADTYVGVATADAPTWMLQS